MYGNFIAYDLEQKPVLLEWQEIPGKTDELDQKIKSLTHLLASSYTTTELLFAQKKPDLVSTDFILKYLTPFFQQKQIDWQLIEQKINEHLIHFFSNFSWKENSNREDKNIFIIAKDPTTKENIGVIQFIIAPDYEKETIKAALYGVIPSLQNRGIERLLMASIFKIKPDINRIFLHTRSTNVHLITLYTSWGFTEFAGQLAGWTDLEYIAARSKMLQESL